MAATLINTPFDTLAEVAIAMLAEEEHEIMLARQIAEEKQKKKRKKSARFVTLAELMLDPRVRVTRSGQTFEHPKLDQIAVRK